MEAWGHIPGWIDQATDGVMHSEMEQPEVDDLLDDMAEQVLKTGGEIIVVPTSEMPAKTGAAASFRF